MQISIPGRYILNVLMILILLGCSSDLASNYKANRVSNKPQKQKLHKDVWYWKDTFSDAEKKKLMIWIKNVRRATRQLFGDYPFDVHFYMKRRGKRF